MVASTDHVLDGGRGQVRRGGRGGGRGGRRAPRPAPRRAAHARRHQQALRGPVVHARTQPTVARESGYDHTHRLTELVYIFATLTQFVRLLRDSRTQEFSFQS